MGCNPKFGARFCIVGNQNKGKSPSKDLVLALCVKHAETISGGSTEE